jgi:hypothetical protein
MNATDNIKLYANELIKFANNNENKAPNGQYLGALARDMDMIINMINHIESNEIEEIEKITSDFYVNLTSLAENVEEFEDQIVSMKKQIKELQLKIKNQESKINRLIEENKILKDDIKSLKNENNILKNENQILKDDLKLLKDHQEQTNQRLILGELARQVEKHICRQLLGNKTRINSFSILRRELEKNNQINQLDQLKDQLCLDIYKDQMIDQLKTLRLPESHPHHYKNWGGSPHSPPSVITASIIKTIAQQHYQGDDLNDIYGLVDILTQLIQVQDSDNHNLFTE